VWGGTFFKKYLPTLLKSMTLESFPGLFLYSDFQNGFACFFGDERAEFVSGAAGESVFVVYLCVVIAEGEYEIVRRFCDSIDVIVERYGLNKEEILVMGDGQNDLGMAKKYPFVAMANALDEVKKAAMRLTLSNDEDGVAFEIERSILN